MNPLSPFFAVIIYLIAFFTGYIIKLSYKIKPQNGRFESVDGMRGFLALGVFICHSSLWGGVFRSHNWDNCFLDSNLYPQFGEASVSLFFMITSFLFISKLLNSREKEFNWRSFFISRIFRLVPMYYFLVLLIVIYVMFICHWKINGGLLELFISIIHWCFFTIYKMPEIDNSGVTFMINGGGVQWSLCYEWLFYFSLPLISIFILKVKPKIEYIILSILFILSFYKFHGVNQFYIYPFIGGAIAPFLLKYTSLQKRIKDKYASLIILICLILICQFKSSNNIYCLILISIIFNFIALGVSLFGLLKNSTLKFLGEISYSTYLLHSIMLYAVFDLGFGFEKMKVLTPLEYCLIIFAITPVLVFISFLGFKYIEKPFIDKAQIIKIKIKTTFN